MSYLPAYRLKLYRDFKALGPHDIYGIVRYYEKHEQGIHSLELDEYFDCTLSYTEALFESGQYQKHLVMCDHLLALIINENIATWGSTDIYTRLLYKKAASLYYTHQWKETTHILRELIKMNPADKRSHRFLRDCLIQQKPKWLSSMRALSVLLILLAAASIALEIFVIRPFFPDWYTYAVWLHNGLLGAGVTTLALGEFRHVLSCRSRVYTFVKEAEKRKRNRLS
jgi:tetratricopeptide (TPR) repeat protein